VLTATDTDGAGKDRYQLQGGSNTTGNPGDSLTVIDALADNDQDTVSGFETIAGAFQ